MSEERRDRTLRMLPLLQVADALDRPRDGSVRDLAVRRRGDVLEIALRGRGLDLARTELRRRTSLFQEVHGVAVEIVDDSAAA